MGQTEIISFIIIFSILVSIFLLAIILFVIKYRQRRLINIQEQEIMKQEHTQELLESKLETQQLTMQDIGREIHDNVGQKLTLASLYVQQLSYQNKQTDLELKLDNISEIINNSLTELRTLSHGLANNEKHDADLIPLLQQEVEKINATGNIKASLNTTLNSFERKSSEINTIYRMMQECIQNSLKHAQATNITITIELSQNKIQFAVADNGKGFSLNEKQKTGNGIGFNNIEKRALLIKGVVDINSKIGIGTTVIITIPNKQVEVNKIGFSVV